MAQARTTADIGGLSPVSDRLALVAIGGNIPSDVGEVSKTISESLKQFQMVGLNIRSISGFYKTPCFPAGAGPDYINAAVALTTQLTARETLDALHKIENSFGRQRIERWGRRTLDLDLVAYDNAVLPDRKTYDHWRALPAETQASAAPDQLVLPHPRVQDRAFVLIPLADVAAGWVHPVLKTTISDMLAAQPDDARAEVRKL
jgi:2-amino-4-hydroxy-6-hydroxymethyldihydropteridine diphosphokinase